VPGKHPAATALQARGTRAGIGRGTGEGKRQSAVPTRDVRGEGITPRHGRAVAADADARRGALRSRCSLRRLRLPLALQLTLELPLSLRLLALNARIDRLVLLPASEGRSGQEGGNDEREFLLHD